MITEGKMQYLFDERGRRYLDVRASCTATDTLLSENISA
jgi:acetylornithine/succinyldiaminopimelate/putrescine aminotransferase